MKRLAFFATAVALLFSCTSSFSQVPAGDGTYTNAQAVAAASAAGMLTGVAGDCTGSGPGTASVVCTKTNGSTFGTMATQSGGSVAITGGSIAGVSITLPSGTISSLPACVAGLTGQQRLVTDALLPAFLATVGAGGSVKVAVFCNGTNWTIF